MGLDIFFLEDIRNALLAANEASAATAVVVAEVSRGTLPTSAQAVTDSTDLLAVSLRAYREGYKAALATVALAFGIAPQAITGRLPEELAGTVKIPAWAEEQDAALPRSDAAAWEP